MSTDTPSLEKAHEELQEAMAAFEEAESKARFARGDLTQATNRLNDKQKRLDKAVELVKEQAPSASDWKSSLKNRRPVPRTGSPRPSSSKRHRSDHGPDL